MLCGFFLRIKSGLGKSPTSCTLALYRLLKIIVFANCTVWEIEKSQRFFFFFLNWIKVSSFLIYLVNDVVCLCLADGSLLCAGVEPDHFNCHLYLELMGKFCYQTVTLNHCLHVLGCGCCVTAVQGDSLLVW